MKRLLAAMLVIMLGVTVISFWSCLPADQKYLKEGNVLYDEGDKLMDQARTNEANEKYSLAVEQFTSALNINPKLTEAYLSRAAAYTNLAKYAEAEADLTKVIEADPQNTMAYYQRSMTYIFDRKYNESIADSNKCIQLGLQNHFVYYNRGVAYARKGDYGFALADFLKAKSLTDNADFNRRMDGEINQLKAATGQ